MGDSVGDRGRSHLGSLPLIGGSLEALVGSPAKEKKQRENKKIIKEMEEARKRNYEISRKAMQGASQAFTPIQALMAQMYGQQAVPDIAGIVNADLFPADHPVFGTAATPQNTPPPAISPPPRAETPPPDNRNPALLGRGSSLPSTGTTDTYGGRGGNVWSK